MSRLAPRGLRPRVFSGCQRDGSRQVVRALRSGWDFHKKKMRTRIRGVRLKLDMFADPGDRHGWRKSDRADGARRSVVRRARGLCTDCGVSRMGDGRACGRACQFISRIMKALERAVHGRLAGDRGRGVFRREPGDVSRAAGACGRGRAVDRADHGAGGGAAAGGRGRCGAGTAPDPVGSLEALAGDRDRPTRWRSAAACGWGSGRLLAAAGACAGGGASAHRRGRASRARSMRCARWRRSLGSTRSR